MALRFIALLHVREYICTNSTIYIINNNNALEEKNPMDFLSKNRRMSITVQSVLVVTLGKVLPSVDTS
jgi:hypothetical protein